MKASPLALLVILAWTLPAWATDRYVDSTTSGCSTPVDTDFNPDTESCGSGSELVYNSITAAVSAHASGDNIYVLAGTYAESFSNTLKSGVSSSQPTKLWAHNGQTVTIQTPVGATNGDAFRITSKNDINIKQLIVDNTNVVAPNGKRGFAFRIDGTIAVPSNRITLDGVTGRNAGIGMFTAHVNFLHVKQSRFHNNGHDEFDHGIYTDNGTNDAIIEYSEFDNNSQMGAQLYKFPSRMQFRYNYVHDNCQISNSGSELYLSGVDNVLEHNVITSDGSCTSGLTVNTGSSTSPTRNILRHNSVYCKTGSCPNYGLNIASASVSNSVLQNNIALGYGTNLRNLGTSTTLTDNLTSGTASAIWTDPGTGDLTLKTGSVAIDGGTVIGLTSCGANPDQGAFETLVITAASISGNVMLVTICSAHPPIIPGTFTVARSGGTPTVLSTSLQGGSGGIVRLEVSETCAAAQTWTVSGGTSTTDSALIGNQFNQPLHTTTNFAVDSSACDGTGGPSAPAGEVAHYEFENDLTDASGNGNTGTGSNISYTTGRSGQGVLTAANVDSYVDTGLLSGHDPSTTHLVVSAWVYIDPADLSQTKDIWGVPTGTNQRFLFYRHSGDTWRMSIGATSGTASEFPVVSGWTHVCVKAHPTGDIATMYINGAAGTVSGASVISGYGSYTFAGDLRFGLPSGFGTSLSGAHILEDAYIYTTDVSCTDLYNAGQPESETPMAGQATHQWQGVYVTGAGVAEDRGAADAQRTVVKGGAAALMVQLDCTGGDCGVVQPRFRYNINGGSFTNVVPDSPTADGVSHWGASLPSGLNNGLADGPISGALTHTDGITLTTSVAIPTITLLDDTSYTLRGIFLIDAAINDVVCFKVYDQGGSELASYTPSAGACLTVIAPQATGGY